MQKPLMRTHFSLKPILFPVQPNSEKTCKLLSNRDIQKILFLLTQAIHDYGVKMRH